MGKTELRCFARLVLPSKLLVLTLNAISNILLFVTLYLDCTHGPSVQLLPKRLRLGLGQSLELG